MNKKMIEIMARAIDPFIWKKIGLPASTDYARRIKGRRKLARRQAEAAIAALEKAGYQIEEARCGVEVPDDGPISREENPHWKEASYPALTPISA